MIRILQYIGPLRLGGSQSFIMEIYRRIDRAKVQFDFIVFPEPDKEMREEIEDFGGRIILSPQYNGKNHLNYVKWWNEFLDSNPDYKILHGHVRSVASIYLSIARRHNLITVIHSHSTSNGRGLKGKIKNIMQFPIRYQADYMFACSKEAGLWLYGKKVCKSKRYKFVPNAIEVQKFYFNADIRSKVRSELGLSDEIVIGNIGRASTPKNQEFILDIIFELNDEKRKYIFLLVGDGELLENLKKKAAELGISDNVIFAGARMDVYRFYNAIDIFVFPSLWEGLPVSIVEAQANGLQCILSDRITRDVKLTDRMSYISLDRGVEFWSTTIKNQLKKETNRYLTDAEKKSIQTFDSSVVAKNLEDFYIELVN